MPESHSTPLDISPALVAVMADERKPAPDAGGPCATCAFRPGSEASRSPHTIELAALCVEGLTQFMCHERPGLCKGWVAAVNLKHAAGEYAGEDNRRHMLAMRFAADMLSDAIAVGVEADRKAGR